MANEARGLEAFRLYCEKNKDERVGRIINYGNRLDVEVEGKYPF